MLMFKFIGRSTQQLFDYLTPCSLCDIGIKRHFGVCQSCWEQLPWLKQSIERNQQQIFVACHYQYPIDRIIQQFKYEQKFHHQRILEGLLQQVKLPKVHAIVPMPISTDRLVERGFNQTLLLAQALSKSLNLPIWQPVQRLAQHSASASFRLHQRGRRSPASLYGACQCTAVISRQTCSGGKSRAISTLRQMMWALPSGCNSVSKP